MLKFRLIVNGRNVLGGPHEVPTEGDLRRGAPAQDEDAPDPGEEPAPAAPGIADLPPEFESPEAFRRRMERPGAHAPSLFAPPWLVYASLIAALAGWGLYGHEYHRAHAPVTLKALVVFLGVFLVLFSILMVFRDLHRRVSMHPVLERMAGLRPGAFLVVEGVSPTLFYARDAWIGKLEFCGGREHRNSASRLDARIPGRRAWLQVRRKRLIDRLFHASAQRVRLASDSEFGRRCVAFSEAPEGALDLLNAIVADSVMRLMALGGTVVSVHRERVTVEVERDLSGPRREALLERFLGDAEAIVQAVSQEHTRVGDLARRTRAAA